MVMKRSKAVPIADRVRGCNQRKQDAGLRQIKVWVADEVHNTEADRVRAYAAKLPETKAITESLK